MRILIIEDEERLSEALVQILTQNKFSSDAALDGEYGLDCALTGIYDVIILDVMLPKMDGFTVLKRIREEGVSTPVLMLTARDEIRDKVKGLDSGADDYLTKPFDTDELMARIRALVRRRPDTVCDDCISFGDLSLNLSTFELSCKGKSIVLGAKELQILELLIRYGDHILSKEELILKVWGYESDAEYNNVEVYISFLRKKLLHLHSSVQIKTIRNAGYHLETAGAENDSAKG